MSQVAARFSAAPDSAAKRELMEELSDNLCRRYEEKIKQGLSEDEAFSYTIYALGDVTELVGYLSGPAAEALRVKTRAQAGDSGNPGETAFSADGLRGVDIRLASGSVTVCFTQPENGKAFFSGNAEELELKRTADGVLLIRQSRKSGAAALLCREQPVSHVGLRLPGRDWDLLQISTGDGDVELTGSCAVGSVTVTTAKGDIYGRLGRCGELSLDAADGDVRLEAETA